MSERNLGDGYTVEIQRMDEGWYWHLFCCDKRVNGGLSETWAGALHASRGACAAHSRWIPSPTMSVYELEI